MKYKIETIGKNNRTKYRVVLSLGGVDYTGTTSYGNLGGAEVAAKSVVEQFRKDSTQLFIATKFIVMNRRPRYRIVLSYCGINYAGGCLYIDNKSAMRDAEKTGMTTGK
jgi:hypothetical protein